MVKARHISRICFIEIKISSGLTGLVIVVAVVVSVVVVVVDVVVVSKEVVLKGLGAGMVDGLKTFPIGNLAFVRSSSCLQQGWFGMTWQGTSRSLHISVS